MFNREEVKPRAGTTSLESFGVPLRIQTIRKADNGDIELTGESMADIALAKAGETVSIFMSEKAFRVLGHDMGQSLKDFADDEAKYANSEVVLGSCWADKETGKLVSRGTGSYVAVHSETKPVKENGQYVDKVVRTREYGLIPNAVVGTPKIKLMNAKGEVFVAAMRTHTVDRTHILGQYREPNSKKNEWLDIERKALVRAMRESAHEQSANIDSKKRGWNRTIEVSLPIFANEDAQLVASGAELKAIVANGNNVFLRSALNAEGKTETFSLFLPQQMDAKAEEKLAADLVAAEKFITTHGSVEAVPMQVMRLSNVEAARVGEAYANYLDSLGANLANEGPTGRWALFEKTLSAYAFGDHAYTKLHLVASSREFVKAETGEVSNFVAIESAVPATNRGFTTFPSVHFSAVEQKAEAQGPEASEPQASDAGGVDLQQELSGEENRVPSARPRGPQGPGM